MCNPNKSTLNNSNNLVYINYQTGEKLDLERVSKLKDNAMLKVNFNLWVEWNFEKNKELGFDIWKVTKGKTYKVWWNCPKCGSDYDSKISNRVHNKRCPYCAGQKVNHTNSLASLNPTLSSHWHPNKNGDLTPHNYTCGSSKKVWWLGECGHEWDAIISCRHKGAGCPYCDNKKILKNFNDMWTTNPELAKLLHNHDDGYKYSQFSNKKVDWKCPDCGEIIKNKIVNDINQRGICCHICGDSMSTPEKILHSLLSKYSDIEFVFDSSRDWSEGRRYDFYIPSINVIIETHGMQHYTAPFNIASRSLEEEQANDNYKYEMAIANGIKPENYIVIDCRKSDFDFIKDNILNSRLVELFNLSGVDWTKVYEMSMKSINIEIVELWNSGLTVNDISKQMGMNKAKIYKTIKELSSMGLCVFEYKKIYTDISNKVYQYDLDKNLIRIWDSTKDIVEHLKLQGSCISRCCAGKQKTSYGFIWKYERDILNKGEISWN